MGTGTAFDFGICARECARCGAPVATAASGGQVTCRRCGATEVIPARAASTPPGPPSLAEELARRSRLKVQLEHPISPNPYSLSVPPREHQLGGAPSLAQLRDGWATAKSRAATGHRTPAEQRDLVWRALHIADAARDRRDLPEARAVLETALPLLADSSHRHLVTCRLVVEAVREGDLASAQAWLGECDPSAEVLELDNAHRVAAARLMAARGAHAEVLARVGEAASELAVSKEYALRITELRAAALEALGRDDEAYEEVAALCRAAGESRVLSSLSEAGAAPKATARRRRGRVDAAAIERDRIIVGARAVDEVLAVTPLVALALLVAVTVPRCNFDADPFFGVHGNALCPHACAGCEGPFRVVTKWTRSGSKSSTNGPQYFCRTATNRVATMTDSELKAARSQLAPYELTFAPAAATYVTLVGMLLPIMSIFAVRHHQKGVRRRAEAEAELEQLAAEAGVPPPPRESRWPSWLGVKLLGVALAAPSLIIALELSLR